MKNFSSFSCFIVERRLKQMNKVFETAEKLKQLWCLKKGEEKMITVSNEEDNCQAEAAKLVLEEISRKELL